MIKYKLFIALGTLFLILLVSCKNEDSPLVTQPGTSSVNGVAKFLDNSIAANAKVELKSNLSGRSIYYTCDAGGNFSFGSLYKGDYTLIFRSTNYDLNTSYTAVSLDDNQSVTKDIYITYNMLDDFISKQVTDKVYFIKFQPDGAKLAGNYSLVDHLSGYYRNNTLDNLTLSASIYKIPVGYDWNNLIVTPDSIPTNFEHLFDVVEEPLISNNHEIRITSDDIPTIFSNPSNGFAFVIKSDSADFKLKIPCVDFNNNDFGLKIFYK